jgi:tRNA modification GTPase
VVDYAPACEGGEKETTKIIMSNSSIDTIVAPATPLGRGGIAIVRISGPLVPDIIPKLLQKKLQPRVATYAVFLDEAQQPLDEGIAIYFPAPHSFTGEEVLELHGHGGLVLVDSLIKRLLTFGMRLARPGEFSERAFLNGKLDLAQAEAIADLIDASSQQAARSALRSLQGEFSKKIYALVEKIIHLRMYIEAAIDFAEEEIDFLADDKVLVQLHHALQQLQTLQTEAAQGSLLREGITAVIAGEPNVGKSTLLNQLSGKEVAIVTDIPGTTRDLLREQINIDGLPMHIIDTAGLRESADRVEQEGIRRARAEIDRADIVLLVIDASRPQPAVASFALPEHVPVVTIRNKIDLIQEVPRVNGDIVSLSAHQGIGIDLLKNCIKTLVGFTMNTEGIFSARRRHLDALARAEQFLEKGYQQLTEHRAGELVAEDLRQAQLALNEITGEFTADDLLGRIFASFCIGK